MRVGCCLGTEPQATPPVTFPPHSNPACVNLPHPRLRLTKPRATQKRSTNANPREAPHDSHVQTPPWANHATLPPGLIASPFRRPALRCPGHSWLQNRDVLKPGRSSPRFQPSIIPTNRGRSASWRARKPSCPTIAFPRAALCCVLNSPSPMPCTSVGCCPSSAPPLPPGGTARGCRQTYPPACGPISACPRKQKLPTGSISHRAAHRSHHCFGGRASSVREGREKSRSSLPVKLIPVHNFSCTMPRSSGIQAALQRPVSGVTVGRVRVASLPWAERR